MVIILYNAQARHEREVGFYRHDQWGFACLADEVRVRGLQRRGQPPVPVPPVLDKQQTRKQYKYNAQSHDGRLKLDVYALMSEAIPFKWSILQIELQIQTPI